MGLLKTFVNLFNDAPDHAPDDHCILLVKIIHLDLSVEEQLVTVKHRDIQQTCEAFAAADDVVEVTVFQRVFHAKKQPVQPDSTSEADAAMLANAALGALKL